MQFKSSVLALVAGSILFSSAASAEDNYVSVGLSSMNYSEDGFDELGLDDYTPLTLDLAVGQQVNKNLGVEFRLGFGMGDESQSGSLSGVPLDASFELNNYWGVYVVPALPVSESSSLYAALGFASVEATVEAENRLNGASVSSDGEESGLSWGLGYRHDFGKNGFQLEFGSVVVSDDFDLTGLSAKYFFKF